MAAGRHEEAIDAFEASLRKSPRHVPTLVNLGIAYHTIRRFKKSAEAYRQALAVDPGHALAHLNLGLVLNEQRRTDEAEAAFLEARRLAPANPDVYAELAALYEETNRLDDMRAALGTGLEHAPGHPRLNLEAAKLARRDGDAEAGLRRLRAIDPGRLPAPLVRPARSPWRRLPAARCRRSVPGDPRRDRGGCCSCASAHRRGAIRASARQHAATGPGRPATRELR